MTVMVTVNSFLPCHIWSSYNANGRFD